mmetsp:Transcript_12510/g.57908  ORF Transcript_12510/g.57908 Transcript_12510/m.57908 type:complete len:722 (+) Transcript_12510:65-2230(+)
MSSTERFSGDDDFRSMKANYVKNQADSALKAGNARDAYIKYTECLNLVPPKYEQLHVVYSNRSLAYAKARKFELALTDAQEACEVQPGWHKAWWRKAAALKALRRYNEALEAFKTSYGLVPEKSSINEEEYRRAVKETTGLMTREQVADFVLFELKAYESRGLIAPPSMQTVADQEKREAMFCHIKSWQSGAPFAKDFVGYITKWALEPMSVTIAYLMRASMFQEANCSNQAIADCQAALKRMNEHTAESKESINKTMNHGPTSNKPPIEVIIFRVRCLAWYIQGLAYEAGKRGCPEEAKDPVKAAKCFKIAANLDDDDNGEYQDKFDSILEGLNNEETGEVLNAVNQQELAAKYGVPESIAKKIGSLLLQVKGTVFLREQKLAAFNSSLRKAFAEKIAAKSACNARDVLIENVSLATIAEEKQVKIGYHFHIGDDEDRAKAYVRDVQSVNLEELGPFTDHSAIIEKVQIQSELIQSVEERMSNEIQSSSIVEASKPSSEIELPYKTYSRVNFDGTPVERVDKHPFCMARVHYNETDEKVWFQASDQSHRWQQSASEIRIMVSNLPVKAKEIDVFISSESLKISNVATGQIFLEGCLQHRIITEESVWDLDEDEGILTIYLQKMNIELFAKPLDHNASDWTSLFRDSFKITFDDCAKNYQDLPEPVMKLYRIREAKEQECRNIDNRESKERDAARELDDLRRRTRMARLGALRGFSVCNGM